MSIIEVRKLSKSYEKGKEGVKAPENIDLTVEKGQIFGIIGMSGAGKSTFVRCLNFLEKPTSGTVMIEGRDLSKLSDKELRRERQQIGMIFQHFNLLYQKNVIDNIIFPLRIQGMGKKEAYERARELLKEIDLEDKEKAYPSQLSGGQQQRVAIARALASNPKILLCDEATSALDPKTTQSILELLKRINQKYGITIVIITHQMSVVTKICTHVAIISRGSLVEKGKTADVFSRPKTKEARELIYLDGEEELYAKEA